MTVEDAVNIVKENLPNRKPVSVAFYKDWFLIQAVPENNPDYKMDSIFAIDNMSGNIEVFNPLKVGDPEGLKKAFEKRIEL